MKKITFREFWQFEINSLMKNHKAVMYCAIVLACYVVTWKSEHTTRDTYIYITLFAIFANTAITAFLKLRKQNKSKV